MKNTVKLPFSMAIVKTCLEKVMVQAMYLIACPFPKQQRHKLLTTV